MASDLASTPRSGLTVQLCGDAHLSNFGMFGSPERHLLFDVNDFDETGPGPCHQAFDKLCHGLEDEPRIISDPPLILPVEELLDVSTARSCWRQCKRLLARITARCRLIGGNC